RAAVAGLGRAIAAWTDQLAPQLPPVVEAARPVTPVPPPPVVIPADFSLAKPPPAARAPAFFDEDDRGITPADLGVIARRCQLKSEAARSVAARLRGDIF